MCPLPALSTVTPHASISAFKKRLIKLMRSVVLQTQEAALTNSGWNRFVLEKPFGKDSESSAALSKELCKVSASYISHF